MENQTQGAVIDDNLELIGIFKVIFRDFPEYKFSYFIDGNVFLDTVNENLDLVLLDIHLPSFNVIEAVKVINIKSPRAYIIIMWDILKQLNRLGIFDFCEKGTMNFVSELKDAVERAHIKIKKRKSALNG